MKTEAKGGHVKLFTTKNSALQYMEKLNKSTRFPVSYIIKFDDFENAFIIIWEVQPGTWVSLSK